MACNVQLLLSPFSEVAAVPIGPSAKLHDDDHYKLAGLLELYTLLYLPLITWELRTIMLSQRKGGEGGGIRTTNNHCYLTSSYV